MSSLVDIACPKCEKTLKVPPTVFGKKVKCKHCEHAFVVRDPDEDEADDDEKPAAKPAKPKKPAAKPAAASPPPPPPPPPPAPVAKSPFADDDEEEGAKKVELIEEEDVPRCPHCTKELEPPDAKVCIHCGFNNITRERAETKKVWAPTTEDWIMHLLPGIIALVIVISEIVWDFVCYFKMRQWMADSFLELDEVDATGKKKFFVPPGFFITVNLIISLGVCVPLGKLAYRRLFKEFKPPEKVKT